MNGNEFMFDSKLLTIENQQKIISIISQNAFSITLNRERIHSLVIRALITFSQNQF